MVERYVIRGGRAGYDRLQLLAQERWPDTEALFQRVGLASGMRCVDLGCGGGEVTFEIARLVRPAGSAVGIDMDTVKLELARQAAAARDIGNVDFRPLNVNEWSDPGAYDVVYCRFLLQHLAHPVALLRRMWEAARPGGTVVVEDADFDGWSCDPPNAGFDFFLRAYSEVIARRGGDHAAGRKLLRYFRSAGFPAPAIHVAEPIYLEGPGKTLALSTLDFTTEAILSEGIASEAELRDAVADLARFTNDPQTLIVGPRIFQVWARR